MGQPLGRDRDPSGLGFVWHWQEIGALGGHSTFGWHPAFTGEVGPPLLPFTAKGKGQKMGWKGAEKEREPGERGRQGEAKPKRWEVTI